MFHLILHALTAIIRGYNETRDDGTDELVPYPVQFVEQLKKLGYFKYCRKEDIGLAERSLLNSFLRNEGFSTSSIDQTQVPCDHRLYKYTGKVFTDKKELFHLMKTMKSTFNKLQVPFEYASDTDLIINQEIDQRITLNGKEYIIYKGSINNPARCGIAVKAFSEMLNDQLKLYRSDERIYLVSNYVEGYLIFLTKNLHSCIASVIKNKHFQPLEIKTWAKWYRVI